MITVGDLLNMVCAGLVITGAFMVVLSALFDRMWLMEAGGVMLILGVMLMFVERYIYEALPQIWSMSI